MKKFAGLLLCGAMLAPLAAPPVMAQQRDRYGNFYNGARRGYNNGYDDSYDRGRYKKDNGIGPGKGALIGTGGGAVLGALFGGGLKGALIGGAAGAGVGALAGKAAQNKRRNDRERDWRDGRYRR